MEREYHLSIFSANIYFFNSHFFATDILPHCCCFYIVVSDIDDYFLLLFLHCPDLFRNGCIIQLKRIIFTNYNSVNRKYIGIQTWIFERKITDIHYLLIFPGGTSARCKVQEIALVLPEPASATEHRRLIFIFPSVLSPRANTVKISCKTRSYFLF